MKKIESLRRFDFQAGYTCSAENNAGTLAGAYGVGALVGGAVGFIVGGLAGTLWLNYQCPNTRPSWMK
jgi:hypothetical protein